MVRSAVSIVSGSGSQNGSPTSSSSSGYKQAAKAAAFTKSPTELPRTMPHAQPQGLAYQRPPRTVSRKSVSDFSGDVDFNAPKRAMSVAEYNEFTYTNNIARLLGAKAHPFDGAASNMQYCQAVQLYRGSRGVADRSCLVIGIQARDVRLDARMAS